MLSLLKELLSLKTMKMLAGNFGRERATYRLNRFSVCARFSVFRGQMNIGFEARTRKDSDISCLSNSVSQTTTTRIL
jgi:hypothetical protein